jgi:hypothetical protein
LRAIRIGVLRTFARTCLRVTLATVVVALVAMEGSAVGQVAPPAPGSAPARPGRLIVTERSARAVHIFVDGVDEGSAPWTGEVSAGAHMVSAAGPGFEAEAQRVDVQAGGTAVLTLDAVTPLGRVELQTPDHQGEMTIDGRAVGEGQFKGELPAGEHVLVITRPGFYRHEEKLALANKQVLVETIGLTPLPPQQGRAERPLGGFYGGFGLAMLLVPAGEGNQLDTGCSELGATSCGTQSPLGGAIFAHFGYTWDPVGLELFIAGEYDQSSPQAVFSGQTGAGENPFVASPARKEMFTFYRAGGVAALRVRATFQSQALRASIAVGPGVSYKAMFLNRTTKTTDGSGLLDVYLPPAVEYASPAVVADASFQLRVTPTTGISLGLLAWVENAGSDARTKADAQRCFGSCQLGAATVPLPTPGYQTASSTQVFVGPYVGVQLGP